MSAALTALDPLACAAAALRTVRDVLRQAIDAGTLACGALWIDETESLPDRLDLLLVELADPDHAELRFLLAQARGGLYTAALVLELGLRSGAIARTPALRCADGMGLLVFIELHAQRLRDVERELAP